MGQPGSKKTSKLSFTQRVVRMGKGLQMATEERYILEIPRPRGGANLVGCKVYEINSESV